MDDVFKIRESCVSALWEGNMCDAQVLPRKGYTAETLVKSLQQCDMSDDIYVTMSSTKERLNDTTIYPQPRRIKYVVWSTVKVISTMVSQWQQYFMIH
jgi:hypothetical protein